MIYAVVIPDFWAGVGVGVLATILAAAVLIFLVSRGADDQSP